MVSKLLIILMIFSVISCQTTGIEFDPMFSVPRVDDDDDVYLVNRFDVRVYQYDPDFQLFGCLSEEKIQELKKILGEASIPNKDKKRILEILNY